MLRVVVMTEIWGSGWWNNRISFFIGDLWWLICMRQMGVNEWHQRFVNEINSDILIKYPIVSSFGVEDRIFQSNIVNTTTVDPRPPVSPDHQQSCYWICKINRAFGRNGFDDYRCYCHCSGMKRKNAHEILRFPKQFSTQRVNICHQLYFSQDLPAQSCLTILSQKTWFQRRPCTTIILRVDAPSAVISTKWNNSRGEWWTIW